jgi:hypothetical protein
MKQRAVGRPLSKKNRRNKMPSAYTTSDGIVLHIDYKKENVFKWIVDFPEGNRAYAAEPTALFAIERWAADKKVEISWTGFSINTEKELD